LDEFRFWGACRTDAEIAANYKKTMKGSEPNLVLNYRFEELSGSPVNTVNNFPATSTSTAWSYDTPVLDQTKALALIVPTLDPDTYVYYQNVIRNGGDLSFLTLQAVDEFVRELKRYNLWNRIYDAGVVCGNSLASAVTKLKSITGSFYLTPFNIPASAYVERGVNGGIKGNASNSYLSMGYEGGARVGNGHLAAYVLGTEANGTSRAIMGSEGAGSSYGNYFGWMNAGTWEVGGILTNGTDYTPNGNTTKLEGALMITQYGPASKYFNNGIQIGATVVPVSTNPPLTVSLNILAYNSNGSPGGYSSRYLRYYSTGGGFNDQESIIYQRLITTLQSRLHRTI